MNEASFASLSPTLLARKGGAKPAMRPQLAPLTPGGQAPVDLEDLGWNDMGDADQSADAPAPLPLTPAPSNGETQEQGRADDRKANETLAESKQPAILRQREELAGRIADPDPAPRLVAFPDSNNGTGEQDDDAPDAGPLEAIKPGKKARTKRRSAKAQGRRAAFTLRLDEKRHLKLRLAATLANRSAQQIVTEALDQWLSNNADVEALAGQVGPQSDIKAR